MDSEYSSCEITIILAVHELGVSMLSVQTGRIGQFIMGGVWRNKTWMCNSKRHASRMALNSAPLFKSTSLTVQQINENLSVSDGLPM